MNSPKFNNGDIVVLDPCGGQRGVTGKIIGVARYIDGTFGYLVSFADFGSEPIRRMWLSDHDFVLREKEDGRKNQ